MLALLVYMINLTPSGGLQFLNLITPEIGKIMTPAMRMRVVPTLGREKPTGNQPAPALSGPATNSGPDGRHVPEAPAWARTSHAVKTRFPDQKNAWVPFLAYPPPEIKNKGEDKRKEGMGA